MDICREKELREAIAAGEQAVRSLDKTEQALKSAMHWGIADILGGGIIIDLFKHSKLDKAKALFAAAQEDIARFQKELGDVQVAPDMPLEISDCLYTFDVFFDNLFSDIMVQDKIEESLKQVQQIRGTICSILEELKNRN